MRRLIVNVCPTVCNLCGGPVVYISNARIYGREYGSGRCYLCTECGAYVGTHVPRPREAFGILADDNMRELKKQCHSLFDALWLGEKPGKARRRARNEAYAMLADKLDIEVGCCHFGYFDSELLHKALDVLNGGCLDGKLRRCQCGHYPMFIKNMFIKNNPSNHMAVCGCGRRTNGCNDEAHALYCWNNEFVI